MPQVPKAQVRQAILKAAAEELAESGYDGTTLAAVAARAGTSIGNLYKYFANKEDLFTAAIPPELAREVGERLRRRIEALGTNRDANALGPEHPYRIQEEEFLEFAVAHRHELVFLLRRARGTAYASFHEDLVSSLVALVLAYAKRAYPTAAFPAARRRALARIYHAFVDSIAAILVEENGKGALRQAVAHLTVYHLAGLQALFQRAVEEAANAD